MAVVEQASSCQLSPVPNVPALERADLAASVSLPVDEVEDRGVHLRCRVSLRHFRSEERVPYLIS